MIRAGELRQRITLQVGVPGTDPRWGEVTDWQDVDEVWASVTPRAAGEKSDAKGQQTEVTHDIVVRFRADVTSETRINWGGRSLEIVGVLDVDARHRELRIEAIERPANA